MQLKQNDKYHFLCQVKINQLEAENARLRCLLYEIINLAYQVVNKDLPKENEESEKKEEKHE